MVIKRAYKYRLYPTKNQKHKLQGTLDLCRDLYNSALQERVEAYKKNGISLNYIDQANELPALKRELPEYELIYAQVLQNVLKRLDLNFKSFFRRLRKHEKPGFPRYRGYDRYDSFTYPQNISNAFSIKNNKLHLAKIGDIKLKTSQPLQGKIKTCTIKREVDRWYVVLTFEFEKEVKQATELKPVALDLGVKRFAVLGIPNSPTQNIEEMLKSKDYKQIIVDNPQYLKKSEKKLKKAHRKLSLAKKGSPERRKKKKVLDKIYRKINNQRNDFLHKLSREIVNEYNQIFLEDLNINSMMRKHWVSKEIADASWGKFVNYISYKAAEAGKGVYLLSPKDSSRTCYKCGYVKEDLTLADRDWICPNCGTQHDRDVNAAFELLNRGLQERLTEAAYEYYSGLGLQTFGGGTSPSIEAVGLH
jgi:putative transposase